jgi:Recombinase
VILVPGPPQEAARVREIYRLKISERKSAAQIARDLNRKGVNCCGRLWTDERVLRILTNPKYSGCATWGRTTGPLGRRRVSVAPHHWAVKQGAFEAVIDQQTFEAAQRALNERTCNKSNDELLDGLRLLLKEKGKLSQNLIDASDLVPTAATYHRRFGGLRQAYGLIGYNEFRNHREMIRMRRRHRKITEALFRHISKIFSEDVRFVRGTGCRRLLCFPDNLKISVLICQCLYVGNAAPRWGVPVNRFERQLPALICRCTPTNTAFKDFFLVPNVDRERRCRFRITENDPWLKRGKQLSDLSHLWRMASQLTTQAG